MDRLHSHIDNNNDEKDDNDNPVGNNDPGEDDVDDDDVYDDDDDDDDVKRERLEKRLHRNGEYSIVTKDRKYILRKTKYNKVVELGRYVCS
jgi:hypothetical protein